MEREIKLIYNEVIKHLKIQVRSHSRIRNVNQIVCSKCRKSFGRVRTKASPHHLKVQLATNEDLCAGDPRVKDPQAEDTRFEDAREPRNRVIVISTDSTLIDETKPTQEPQRVSNYNEELNAYKIFKLRNSVNSEIRKHIENKQEKIQDVNDGWRSREAARRILHVSK